MMKCTIAIIACLFCFNSFAQQPYIGTAGGDGLGQYGYLEKDAVTFSRLFRNTYDNIAYLSARWWLTDNNAGNGAGKEYIHNVHDYHVSEGGDWDPLIGWQCGGDNDGSKRTSDFAIIDFSPEWNAGTDCYVSVCAKFCDDSFYPASFNGATTNGAVGFNERHFRVVDVDATIHSSIATNMPDDNGVCATNNASTVAGSFMITPNQFTGISLTRLFVENTGTALEGIDIPNGALNVYYEAVTGTEVYGDANETYAGTLWGDWGGGSTSDNIFGNEALNIPLNGAVRIYVLLCDFNSPVSDGKSINLGIINDGISLAPDLDTYTKLRINPVSISQRNITLPLKFIAFTGTRNSKDVQLKWQIDMPDYTGSFIIQQSVDGIHFTDGGIQSSNNFYYQKGNYIFSLSTNATYFRIVVKENGSIKMVSKIIRINELQKELLSLQQNVADNKIIINSTAAKSQNYQLRLSDMSGRILMWQKVIANPGSNTFTMPANIGPQILLLSLHDEQQKVYSFKVLKQ